MIPLKRKILDRAVYPLSTRIESAVRSITQPHAFNASFHVDRFFYGERGLGLECIVRAARKHHAPAGARVLIQGCGTGTDALHWAHYGAEVTGIDLYEQPEWASIPSVRFVQGDVSRTNFPDASFDVIASVAVWEHIQDWPSFLAETKRLLAPNGLVVASFGPLWYTYGGDHFCAGFGDESAFQHVLLNRADYLRWVDTRPLTIKPEHVGTYWDIRKHIHDDLFSHLTPSEYIAKADATFRRVETWAGISPDALRFRERFPRKWEILRGNHAREDLIIKSLVLFLRHG